MYDYDKVLEEALDELFENDFETLTNSKIDEENLGYTLLNIPRSKEDNSISEISLIKNEEIDEEYNDSKNDWLKKYNKRTLGFATLILFFLVLFIGAYPKISENIFINERASAVKKMSVDYVCDIIAQGELKTTGSGKCKITNNKIKLTSSFSSLEDNVNYMLIITNNESKTISIKKFSGKSESNNIDVSYKVFYNNKELKSEEEIVNEDIMLKSKESLVIIIEQKYNKNDDFSEFKTLDYSINIGY